MSGFVAPEKKTGSITIRISKELEDKLREIAKTENVTLTFLIVDIVSTKLGL
jgi:predicted transcriptional regulator